MGVTIIGGVVQDSLIGKGPLHTHTQEVMERAMWTSGQERSCQRGQRVLRSW